MQGFVWVISLACLSRARLLKCSRFFFSVGPSLLETGDKNRDDFLCMEMSLVMRMQFISAMTEMTHVSLAMT